MSWISISVTSLLSLQEILLLKNDRLSHYWGLADGAGFDALSVAPFRTIRRISKAEQATVPIAVLKKAWNTGNLIDWGLRAFKLGQNPNREYLYLKLLGRKPTPHRPSRQDMALFGMPKPVAKLTQQLTRMLQKFPQGIHLADYPGQRDLGRVSENDPWPATTGMINLEGLPVALDIHWLNHLNFAREVWAQYWIEEAVSFVEAVKNNVVLLDFHLTQEEVSALLANEFHQTQAGQTLQMVKEIMGTRLSRCPISIEFPPLPFKLLGGEKITIARLSEIREKSLELIWN